MFTLYYFIFLIILINIIRIQSQTINYYGCNCDLTAGVCDTNCCCDTACTAQDILSFSCSLNTNSRTQRWCLPNTSLFKQNTPYIINSLGDLLCIDYNNSLSLSYYQASVLDSVTLKEDFVKNLVNQVLPASIANDRYLGAIDINSRLINSFNSSDYVWLIFSNNIHGYLTLPAQIGSSCANSAPINYLINKNTNCFITTANINRECANTQTTSLSLQYFINNFKIIQVPNFVQGCTGAQTDYYNNPCTAPNLTPISIRSCTFADGTRSTDPTVCSNQLYTRPQNNAQTNVCDYLVKSITYLLRYSNPKGVIEAAIDVEFFNSQNVPSQQTFSAEFIPNAISIANYNVNSKLSGNPGYLTGEPIQAVSQNGPINGDRNKRFTYLQPDSSGNCPSSTSFQDSLRSPVKFGQNVAAECLLSLNTNPLPDCVAIQNQIDNILLGFAADTRAYYYAQFASDPQTIWAAIVNSAPPTQPVTSSANGFGGICKSVRNNLNINIAYSLLGNLENPQAKVIYVTYDWTKTTDLNFRCGGQYCVNPTIRLTISTKVTFVDVSQPPLYPESKMTRPFSTLPGDFFYPLASSASTMNQISSLIFILVILVLKLSS